ncbi:TonB-dependent receptor [Gayadomonas joobiniege]|uniref:TonB-dependent receptor n=1 Tax=Gayadomonas joobiniege TaxID=1234606 RepID=UPI0003680188|nr:TonB-dependent receptor [Gayadomonas joobiniege]
MHTLNKISFAVISILLSSSALAQADQLANQTEIEEVVAVASPIRDSQKAAIDAKRQANNFVDIVAADTIGRFPDQNLADSLGRVPGLAIERDQGQARYINFRGAPFRYTSIAIDGILIPGAENGRIPRFDSFPSVITSRIEANKAITAKMPAESIAGFINIHTFNPFDSQGFALSADLGRGQQQLGDGDVKKQSARLSWSGEEWGVSAFASQNSREQITDNREFDLELENAQLKVNELDFRSYKIKREDSAIGGRLEYRPNGSANRIFLSSLRSEFKDFEQRNQYVFDLAGGAEALGVAQPLGERGELPLILVTRMLEDGVYKNSTFTTTLGADIQLGQWFVESRLNHTKTENHTALPIIMSAGGKTAGAFDISNLADPILTLYKMGSNDQISAGEINQPKDNNDYAMHLAYPIESQLEIKSNQLKIDAERYVKLFADSQILTLGVAINDKQADGFGMSAAIGGFPQAVNIDDFITEDSWDSDFTNSIQGQYFDNQGLKDAWQDSVDGSLFAAPSDDLLIKIDETISSGYAMLTTDYGWGNWVIGLRAEHTNYTSTGPEASHSDSELHWLPSAHLNYNLSDKVKLRASFNTAISRPTYNEWRGSASYDLTQSPVTVSGGNPALKAEESIGADFALEWYAADASLLSAGLFTRSIDNVIYADSSEVDGGLYNPEYSGETWQYSGFVNGKDGQLNGLELNAIVQLADFIDGPFNGFGFSANATFLDSEFTSLSGNKFSLPGTSDAIYNASVFFESVDWSIRLNYQFRDDWLSTTENDSMGEYWDAQTRVDLSANYQLPWQISGADISLYANLNNLTDEVDTRYIGTEQTPNQIERYGKRYLVGVRVNY